MLSAKTKLSNRKFYNKWLYKTTLEIEGCSIFRLKNIQEIKEFCYSPDHSEHRFSIWSKAYKNKNHILDICEFLESLDKNLYQTRVERNFIDFYTNEKSFYNNLSNKFQSVLKHRFEPSDATIEAISESTSSIAVKKLPKNRYQYRVYLLPHKLAGDKEAKIRYITWLKSQNERITCTKAIEKWFIETDWNWDRRYVLVEDERTLLMLKLRNAELIGRIYNFVITDK